MPDQPSEHNNLSDQAEPQDQKAALKRGSRRARAKASSSPTAPDAGPSNVTLCWPFPAGSQNDTEKAVQLKPYAPLKRRTLNQY